MTNSHHMRHLLHWSQSAVPAPQVLPGHLPPPLDLRTLSVVLGQTPSLQLQGKQETLLGRPHKEAIMQRLYCPRHFLLEGSSIWQGGGLTVALIHFTAKPAQPLLEGLTTINILIYITFTCIRAKFKLLYPRESQCWKLLWSSTFWHPATWLHWSDCLAWYSFINTQLNFWITSDIT